MSHLKNARSIMALLDMDHLPDKERLEIAIMKLNQAFQLLQKEQNGKLFTHDLQAHDEMIENARTICSGGASMPMFLSWEGPEPYQPREISSLEHDIASDEAIFYDILHPARYAFWDLVKRAPCTTASGTGNGDYRIGTTEVMIFHRIKRIEKLLRKSFQRSYWPQGDINNYIKTASSFIISYEDQRFTKFVAQQ